MTTRPATSGGGSRANRCLRSLVQRGEIDAPPRRFHLRWRGDNILIRRLCAGGRVADAARVLAALGGPATIVTYNTMVNGYYRAGHINAARRLIGAMPFAPDTFTFNPLIRVLCVRGRVPDALVVLDDMLHRGCSRGHLQHPPRCHLQDERLQAGYGAPRRDARKGCQPDVVTYNDLVNAMCNEQLQVVLAASDGMRGKKKSPPGKQSDVEMI
ncbi:hypothetical protein ACP70R_038383 [Stipagrostis hirtigluma subsp. patula]